MSENFDKLLESLTFRFKSIFSFKDMSFFACFCKIILLIILGIPFCIVEFFSVIFALCSCFPFIGIIFTFTFCLFCDLLSSLLFYLIMLPSTRSSINTIQTVTQKKLVFRIKLTEDEYQDVYDALSWCSEEVDGNTESVLERFKDKLFLNSMSGSEGLYLKNIFTRVKINTSNSVLNFKLEKAISILEKRIYKE